MVITIFFSTFSARLGSEEEALDHGGGVVGTEVAVGETECVDDASVVGLLSKNFGSRDPSNLKEFGGTAIRLAVEGVPRQYGW